MSENAFRDLDQPTQERRADGGAASTEVGGAGPLTAVVIPTRR